MRVAHVVKVVGPWYDQLWARRRACIARTKEFVDSHLAESRLQDPGGRVYGCEPRQQDLHSARLRYVCLGNDDLVRRCGLLERLRVAVEVQVSVDRIDSGEDLVHREVVLQDGVGEDR